MSDLDEIERLRKSHATPGMTAGEFAELLPEHLRQPYWHSKIAEYVAAEGIDPDREEPR